MARPNWFFGFPVDGDFVESLPAPPPGIRRYHAADVHLTLAFLGRCSEEAALRALAALDTALRESPLVAFEISLGEVVAMGPSRRYSALAALLEEGRAEATATLLAMRNTLTLAALGRRVVRPPKPHVTLARPRPSASVVAREAGLDWARALDVTGSRCRLDRIALYTWSEERRERLFRLVAERQLLPATTVVIRGGRTMRPRKQQTSTGTREEPSARKRALAPASVEGVLAWLERRGSEKNRQGMARYAIPSEKAYGVSVAELRAHAKRLGKSHELAAALWATDRYEARMLAIFVEEPARVTPKQMDSWCRDFDSWAICDTACFHLFDRTPHAWRKLEQWSGRRQEFVRRAAFALLASLSVHDKHAGDEHFLNGLELIERAARDERNFVKKAVNWALRSVGKRNRGLNVAAVGVAQRLANAPEAAPRWVGKAALRELTSDAVTRRLAARTRGS